MISDLARSASFSSSSSRPGRAAGRPGQKTNADSSSQPNKRTIRNESASGRQQKRRPRPPTPPSLHRTLAFSFFCDTPTIAPLQERRRRHPSVLYVRGFLSSGLCEKREAHAREDDDGDDNDAGGDRGRVRARRSRLEAYASLSLGWGDRVPELPLRGARGIGWGLQQRVRAWEGGRRTERVRLSLSPSSLPPSLLFLPCPLGLSPPRPNTTSFFWKGDWRSVIDIPIQTPHRETSAPLLERAAFVKQPRKNRPHPTTSFYQRETFVARPESAPLPAAPRARPHRFDGAARVGLAGGAGAGRRGASSGRARWCVVFLHRGSASPSRSRSF